MSHDIQSGPHAVDRHVGLRIRMRRKELGLTQENLGEALGLTFQQVQKYERATNRVSASKLWQVAQALETSVGYFYEGLDPEQTGQSAGLFAHAHDFLLSSEGQELAGLFPQIPERRARRKILELIRVMADDEDTATPV